MNTDRLLQRFLNYVKIDTTANPDAEGYPSSTGQLDLGRLLAEELRQMGLSDARQNEHGIVMATVPATVEGAPTIAFCAHMDTSPETSGKNVRPQVIRDYPGGDIVLPGDKKKVILVAENHELKKLLHHTLITSDGTTLLGGDDKAGVAIIMETAQWLLEHPEIPHGPVRICFTCDEEVGRGVDKLDPREIDAVVCYTLDGHGSNEIDTETFSADQATVAFHGVNIHPSIAKDRMTNAVRVAAEFIARLPRKRLAPEATEGREGFLHPFDFSGNVAEAKLKLLLRDFDAVQLAVQADLLRKIAADVMHDFPAAKIEVNIQTQYRNMAEGLIREPRAVEFAEEALRRLGRTPKRTIVRGGTDGSRLTEIGLPTPNLSCGDHTPHSPLEWVCLEEMAESGEWLLSLVQIWAEDSLAS